MKKRSRAAKCKANESTLSTVEVENRSAKVKLLAEELVKNSEQRIDFYKARIQEDLRALDDASATKMRAIPKEHLEMNFYEYLKMKKEEEEAKTRESLNETVELRRPTEAKENIATARPKNTKQRMKNFGVMPTPANIFAPSIITPKCDSTKPLSAIPTRNFRPGETLFSIAGSPVDPLGYALDETKSKNKKKRGLSRVR